MELSTAQRDQIRQVVLEASEPIAPFWPMRTMVAQNPIHGLEYLPFDQAVRKGKDLLGGSGYLPNEAYRQLYHEGRITPEGIERALVRVGPRPTSQDSIKVGTRMLSARDIWQWHLVYGFEALEPVLLQWELGSGGATQQFRSDLPMESKQRIIKRTIEECEQCRDYPEEAYLTNLWKASLSVLALDSHQEENANTEHGHGQSFFLPKENLPIAVELPPQRTVSDWVDQLAEVTLVDQINNQMIQWIAAFVDEGLAGWAMPSRDKGFFLAWQDLAQWDQSGRLLGIPHFQQKVQELPGEPEDIIVACLRRLGLPQEQWKTYLSRELSQLPGWTRYIRWLGEHPGYRAQTEHPIDTTQYLAVRLFYEVELCEVVCEREWGIAGNVSALTRYWEERVEEYADRMGHCAQTLDPLTQAMCEDAWRVFHLAQCLEVSPSELHDLSLSDTRLLLGWIDALSSDLHGPVWLEAYEDAFRVDIIRKLAAHREKFPTPDVRPRGQMVFCIDVRSESFRRHIEAQGPYETFGFAGFFGIPVNHQAFDNEERSDLCPVLLSPKHAVGEIPRPGEQHSLQHYSTGTRWNQLGHHLFHDLKRNPIGSLVVIDVLGLFFSLGLIGKTLFLKPYHAITSWITRWFAHPVPTQIAVSTPSERQNVYDEGAGHREQDLSGLAQGFTLSEQVMFIENGLRAMGLTKNFSRLIVLCGHGSQTDNNPYFGALDCGACGGNPGDANARVFATMANHKEVRRSLKENGLNIPDDTWFLPAKHNTTTDRVTFYDVEEFPSTHEEDLRLLIEDLQKAGAQQALERCQRIPHAPTNISSEEAFAHVEERSMDWANSRPEWGLAGNAAFLIGPRSLTKGLDLGGRVFLHSYDPLADPEGAILEKIMTAPLIVGEWINTGYYFSGVDPWNFGSGSKVIHNVVGGVGVMLGSQSDLQMGFPLQTVNNGDVHFHEPLRLLAIIEAIPSVISSIIQKHKILQQLFHNGWLNLVALNPKTLEFHRYNVEAKWEALLNGQ
ncbi:MAG: DUF2309 domain-containing protein [Nitrospirales bacterium]